MSILDYIEKMKRENESPRITAQEPRNMPYGTYGDEEKVWPDDFKGQVLEDSTGEYRGTPRNFRPVMPQISEPRPPQDLIEVAQGGRIGLQGGQLVRNTVDGSRPGYSGKMKWTTKEVQEIYANLPEGMNVQVRTLPSGRRDYTYRARVLGKNVDKPTWNAKSMAATPENKKKMIKLVEAKYDEYYPNRLSREEYAKLRLKPENRRLRGEDFAKKLNKAGYTTYTGDEWARANVYNYDKETPRGKPIAKDLGFFEKRTVAEAKDIIKQYSGGKHFLKNKNLTDTQITTKAAEYVAMEKNIEKTGGTYSFPRGKQNKRKIWQNIYSSHDKNGRFKLANADELPKFEDGRINWRKDKAWRKAKFKDSKSGKTFTYDNLEKMVDQHGGGWNKAVKAYDDNARLNQTTFKGKALNEWFREGMIKKEYETLTGKKVPFKDKGLQKYMGEKKPYYSFTEAHHFKGVKDHPFDTESSFRYANRRQGNIQNSYDKAIKSGKPDRIAKAKIKYAEDMKSISDEMGGIRYKMDDTRFVGAKGTEEGIIRTGAKVSGMSDANQIKLFKQLGYRCRRAAGGEETVACYMSDVEQTRADMKSPNVEVRAKALTKQRKALQLASKIPQLKKILKTGVQLGTAAITKPLEWLGLTSGIGYAIEGIVEGGFYDNARRKGFSHEQAMAETLTPGLIAGRPHDVPWYGGAEKLREKELYGVREAPTILEDGTIVEGDLIPGKVQPKVKQYVDALEEQDRIYEAIGAKEQAKKEAGLAETGFDATLLPGDLDAASADVQDLARSGAYGRVDRTLDPESMASRAYNTAVERQQALDQRRRTDYLEKVEPGALEREEEILSRPRQLKKRYQEMDEMYPNYSNEEIDKFLEQQGIYINPSLRSSKGRTVQNPQGLKFQHGLTYDALRKYWDTLDKQSYFADNFRMEKAGGGMVGIRKPNAIPPEKQGLRSIMIDGMDD